MSSTTPLNSPLHDAVPGHDAKSGIGGLQRAAGKHGDQHDIERGYVPVRQLYGKVVGVWGDAHIRHLDGTVTVLHVGDVVKKGEVVLTAQDGIIQIEASHTLLAQSAREPTSTASSRRSTTARSTSSRPPAPTAAAPPAASRKACGSAAMPKPSRRPRSTSTRWPPRRSRPSAKPSRRS